MIAYLLSILGILLVVFGLITTPKIWDPLIHVSSDGIFNIYSILLISLILILGASKSLKKSICNTVLILATLLLIVFGAFWALLSVILFLASSVLIGMQILQILKIKTPIWELQFLLGAGFLGTLVGLIAHLPINYSGVYFIALCSPIIICNKSLVICLFEKIKLKVDDILYKKVSLEICFNAIYGSISGAFFILFLLIGLMPELGYDSLVTHLFIPVQVAARHFWGFDIQLYVWAVMPALGDWIFTLVYLLGGETACRLVCVLFLVIVCLILRRMVIWLGAKEVGIMPILAIFLSTPIIFTLVSSLYVDIIWAAFVLMATFVLFEKRDDEDPYSMLGVAGLLIGFSLAAKAATYTFLPGLIIVWFIRNRHFILPIYHHKYKIFQGVFLALSFGCIPYITAYLISGNPVFPLFNAVFKSPFFWNKSNFTNDNYISGFSWDILYQITFNTSKFIEARAGTAGFEWLILFVPCLLILFYKKNKNARDLFIVGLLGFFITFYFQSYLRYCLPSIIVFLSLLGAGLSLGIGQRKYTHVYWNCVAMAVILLNTLFINAGNQFYWDFPLRTIKDNASKVEYLYERLPNRNLVQIINLLNIKNSAVAIFAEPLNAGIEADVFYPNWYNTQFATAITGTKIPDDMQMLFKKNKIEFVIVDNNWNGNNGLQGAAGDIHAAWWVKDKKELIRQMGKKILDYGSFSVYQVER